MTGMHVVTRPMIAVIVAIEAALVLTAIGAVLQAGPLRGARAIVYPTCNAVRVVGKEPATASPRAPVAHDPGGALCPDIRYGLAAVLVLLPVMFPLQVYRGVRKSR